MRRRGAVPMGKAFPILATNAREARRSLSRAKLRTALALIGIVIGIGSVITMISLGEIARAESLARFASLGTDIISIQNRNAGSGGPRITLEDAAGLAVSIPSITQAAPRIMLHGKLGHAGRSIGSGAIQGVTESFLAINKLVIERGRFVSELDVRRNFCVVGSQVAERMRRVGATRIIGEVLVAEGRLFTVVGVLRPATDSYSLPFSVEANTSIFVPITTAERFGPQAEIGLVIARAGPDVHHEAAARDIESWFRGRSPKLRIEVESAKQLIEQMESQMQLMTLLLAAIGSVSLIVGGIGVMNIMLVSVAERRREIGIRRALGARRRDIQNQFLIECVLLSLAGGVLGVAVGVASTWIICEMTQWSFFISEPAVASGIAAASVVGVLFGFQPAYQAARLDPIEALEAE